MLDRRSGDANISVKLGDHRAAAEIQLPNELIKLIPARRFNRGQKTIAKRSAKVHIIHSKTHNSYHPTEYPNLVSEVGG